MVVAKNLARWIALAVCLAFCFVSVDAANITSGSSHPISDSRLSVHTSYQASFAGERHFQLIVSHLLVNKSAVVCSTIAVLDTLVNHIADPATYSIISKPRLEGGKSADIHADTTWTGAADSSNLVHGSNSLLPGQIAVLRYVVEVSSDSLEEFTFSARVTGSGGVDETSTPPPMKLPVETPLGMMAISQVVAERTYVDATHSDLIMQIVIWNVTPPGGEHPMVLIQPSSIPDTLANYITGGNYTVLVPPFVFGGTASVIANPGWTGEDTNASLGTIISMAPEGSVDSPQFPGSFPAQYTILQYKIRVTHGANECFSNRVWANATSGGFGNLPVSASHFLQGTPSNQFCAAPLLSTPIIAGAQIVGPVGGVATRRSVPCTTIVKNMGTAPLIRPNVRNPIGSSFPATSGLDSVRNVTSRLFTVNSAFDGTTAHDSLLRSVAAETLAAGASDTVAFVAWFHEGDKTSWSNKGRVLGTTTGGSGLVDTTNCNIFENDPDGEPNEAVDNLPCSWQIPTGTPATKATIVVKGTGNSIFCVGFPQGSIDSSVCASGNGLALRDTAGEVINTQFATSSTIDPKEPLRFWCWPDGSLRTCQMATKWTHSGTWQVHIPAAAQTADSVTTSEPPNFNVRFKYQGADSALFDLTRAQVENTPQPVTGRILRRAFHDTTNGWGTYLGSPGAMEIRVYHDYWADGTIRSWVSIRNQKRATNWQLNAGNWGGDVAAETTASVRFIRETGDTMRIRWAADMGLGSGADTSIVSVWHPGSYDHPSGEQYDYGGRWRAGESLRFELGEGQGMEPPMVLQPADEYISTKAWPWTDVLVKHRGAAWNSPDSLLSVIEHHAREWSRRVQTENPPASWWKSPLMFGNCYRQFDGSAGPTIDACRGGQQYETELAHLWFLWSIAGVASDSLNGYAYADSAWKSIEQQVHMDQQASYNVDYDFEARKNGIIFPHTTHGSSGLGNIGRSNQKPVGGYCHGLALLPVAMITGSPFLQEDWNRKKTMIHDRVTFVNGVGADEFSDGEGRAVANLINWAAMICDFEPTTTRWTDLKRCVDVNAARWSGHWNEDPEALGCDTDWWQQKPWMLAFLANGLYQTNRIQTRWNRFTDANVTLTLANNYSTHGMTYAAGPRSRTIRDVNCQNPTTVTFMGMFYQWGEDSHQNPCTCLCQAPSGIGDGLTCVYFWNVLSSSMISRVSLPFANDLIRGPVHFGDGGYDCPFVNYGNNYFQKQGIMGHWYHEWAKARGY